jgi:hypothetical protein
VIERISDYADGCIVYLGSPPPPVGLAGAAQQQQSLEYFGSHGDKKRSTPGLLPQVLIVAECAVSVVVLLEARDFNVKKLECRNSHLLLPVGRERGEAFMQVTAELQFN